ncbi:chemotaxis protein CheA [Sporolactobacillus terrae]|uniref:Chemotaxis protein CheA n=1 Tax=Sporolactobacillus terrae TaxID=269673 RepID=A0A5K7WWC6_9BACL|nr:chemotaxis protein CheA [Sporolactobacillus terrae]BBN98677.1 chemotaxis protein CheA [Sporolactobacillus terrae]
MDMSQYLGIFLDEAREHLQNLNDQLMTLEEHSDDSELLNSIFRSAHTLKGSSGQMGFNNMMELTHTMENVFDALRNKKITASADMVDVLFEGLDHLAAMIDSIEQSGSDARDVAETKKQLEALTGKKDTSKSETVKSSNDGAMKQQNDPQAHFLKLEDYEKAYVKQALDQNLKVYEIQVTLNKDCVLKAARAYMIANALEEEGTILATRPATEAIEKEEFDQKLVYLAAVACDEQKLKHKIETISEVAALDVSSISEIEEQRAPQKQQTVATEKKRDQTSRTSAAAVKKPVAVAKTLRVNLDRIDQLMNLFEELMIDRGRLERVASDNHHSDLSDTVEKIKRVTNQMQETLLNLRMEPIEQVFNRFPRLVRSLSKELNKKVNFVVKGGDTELDRTVIEELGDPLMHMIRNSMDHGIELPAVREAKGKNPEGTLTLAAYYNGNQVIVEIKDDGAGINREKVLDKAIEKNVVTEEEARTMTENQIDHLLFASGFSTADKISDISGRGVGLDVVESKIQSLNGTVEVVSAPDQGTTFTVKLPMTLSIINALLVQTGEEVYAVPITSITETALKRQVKTFTIHDQTVMDYRESVIPLVSLADYFAVPDRKTDKREGSENRGAVVILSHGDKKVALTADQLLGYQDVVVKPLGKYLEKVPGFSGTTILGDGRAALIIDCQRLIETNKTIKERA